MREEATVTRRNSVVFWSTPEVKMEVPSCVQGTRSDTLEL